MRRRDMEPRRRVVIVIASDREQSLASGCEAALTEQGQRVVGDPSEADSAVILVSGTAVHDPHWLTSVEQARALRVVPLAVGQVDPSSAPDYLTEPNWIMWDGGNPAQVWAKVLLALSTDLETYRQGKTVETQARIWEAHGRHTDYLLEGVHGARQAVAELEDHARSVAPPSELAQSYVLASYRQALKRRRRLWGKRGFWTVVFAVVIGVMVAIGLQFRTDAPDVAQTYGLQLNPRSDARPDLVAIKGLGTWESLVATGVGSDGLPQLRIVQALSVPWSSGPVAPGQSSPTEAVDLLDGGREAVVLSSDGEVSWWRVPEGELVRSVPLSVELPYLVDATPDGSLVVAAGPREVALTKSDGEVELLQWDAPTADLALSHDGRHLAIATTDGRLHAGSVAQLSEGLEAVATCDAALDLVGTADRVLALCRSGAQLLLVDAGTGELLEAIETPEARFESGALNDLGHVAWVGAGEQLWFATSLVNLRPVGLPVPPLVRSLDVGRNGVVAFASDSAGVRVVSAEAAVELGRPCRSIGQATVVTMSGDGRRLACLSARAAVTQDLTGWAPVGQVPAAVEEATLRADGPGPLVDVSVLVDETVGVAVLIEPDQPPAEFLIDPLGVLDPTPSQPDGARAYGDNPVNTVPGLNVTAPVTVVEIHPSGWTLALGTQSGEVMEIDLVPVDQGESLAPSFALASQWSAPTRSAVTRVEWGEGTELKVVTEDGWVWLAGSCAGCNQWSEMVERVSERRWSCYPDPTAVELVSPELADEIQLRECPAVEAGGGE